MNTDDPPPPSLFEEPVKEISFALPEEYSKNDAECLTGLQELDEAKKENEYMPISVEMWVPFDFGFDYEKCDKDNRNRLEETMTKLEKIIAEDIVVPGCSLAECKRAKDGVRIKAYWAEHGEDLQNHILLHVCKYTFPDYDTPQIVVLCRKRGGDIFLHIDIVRQLKALIQPN